MYTFSFLFSGLLSVAFYLLLASRDLAQVIAQEMIKTVDSQKAELAESNRLKSLGLMASGIAHEINTPLSVIQTNSYKVMRVMNRENIHSPDIKKAAENILKMVERMSSIIRGLHTFSRDGSHDKFEKVHLGDLIDDIIDIAREKFQSRNIEIRKNPMVPFYLECQKIEIGQVILNLLNNASDAVQNLDQKWVSIEAEETSEAAIIRFTDSGLGIPSDIKEKLMTPFFTPKDPGKGTGLVLSISHGIVKSHGGVLEINDKSLNTQFIIRIPKNRSKPIQAA